MRFALPRKSDRSLAIQRHLPRRVSGAEVEAAKFADIALRKPEWFEVSYEEARHQKCMSAGYPREQCLWHDYGYVGQITVGNGRFFFKVYPK